MNLLFMPSMSAGKGLLIYLWGHMSKSFKENGSRIHILRKKERGRGSEGGREIDRDRQTQTKTQRQRRRQGDRHRERTNPNCSKDRV